MEDIKINKQEFKTWINALRSGEYEQTKQNLQTKYGFCCLGVACKVLIPDKNQELNNVGELLGGYPSYQFHSPQWLKDIDGLVSRLTGTGLSNRNDENGYTFKMMADFLEKTFPEDSKYFQN